MFKALLKKQLLELNAFYFRDRKTGKRRTKAGAAFMIVLFVFLFALIGVAFFAAGSALAPLTETPFSWLYFTLMGMIALVFGIFGSVFNTYAGLYNAKDNDLLLSMPIPPAYILFVRVSGVALMGLLYESIVFIPAIIARFVFAPFDAGVLVCSIFVMLVVCFLITALTCILGWLVALIASKMKNKSFATVAFSLIFITTYYYVYAKASSGIGKIVENSGKVAEAMKNFAYPLYLMGRAAEGDVISLVIFTLGVGIVFAITYTVLSRTFIGITTKKTSTSEKKVKRKERKKGTAESALLSREWRHYLSSPTYILNCSLGTLFTVLIGSASLIWQGNVREYFARIGIGSELVPVIAAAFICLIVSMNDLTAPSVSLEGKNLWIVRSLPVEMSKVLDAKQLLHMGLTLPGAVFAALCLSVSLRLDLLSSVEIIALSAVFTAFTSCAGLAVGLKMPNLEWSSEIVPIKQGGAVMIALFGGWGIALIVGIGGYFALNYIDVSQYLLICLAVFVLASRLINDWLKKSGAKLFENL